MGKKDAAEMAKQKTRFVGGAVKAGHDEQRSSDLFDLLAKFAEYGFNKSHSAAYGFVAYQTAWLKANHRAEYMASLMSIDAGNSDKILVYIGDCRRAGIKILPPDINHSVGPFDVPARDRRSIRYGLNAIKGIGESAVEHLVEERNKGGPFRDFLDLLTRCDFKRINKKVLEGLIKSGALDSFEQPRARFFAALEDAMRDAQQQQAMKAQVGLFAGAGSRLTFKLPNVGEWTVGERMRNEKEALGFFLTGHPAEDFRPEVDRFGFLGTDQLNHRDDQSEVSVCGVVALKKVIKTKKGDPMAFVNLEDIHGQVECVFFTRAFEKARAVLDAGRPILVRGKLERKEDGNKILAETAELMDDIRERRTTQVRVEVGVDQLSDDTLAALQAIFAKNRGDCATRVVVRDAAHHFVATLKVEPGKGVKATPQLHEGLTGLLGAGSVGYA
jgi:DNA polymerase-3 subunit alpha